MNYRVATIGTGKRSLRFVRKICFDDLAGGFLLGAEHEEFETILA